MIADYDIYSLTQKRAFGSNIRSGVYREKTAREVWFGDVGAYPVMGVIAFAGIFCAASSLYLGSGPDTRLNKNDRKNPFRGALKDEFAKEQKH